MTSPTTPTAAPTSSSYAGIAVSVLLAFGVLFAVAFDQGQIANLAQSAAGDVTLHEVFHDARHMLGFPCH